MTGVVYSNLLARRQEAPPIPPHRRTTMVKRYYIDCGTNETIESAQGAYVFYSDYASLESLNRELVEVLNQYWTGSYFRGVGHDDARIINSLLTKLKESQ